MINDFHTISHFLGLVGEYSIVPVLLWVITYIPKMNKIKSNFSDEKIQNYGYEFVLIESLTHFSLFLRAVLDVQPCKAVCIASGFCALVLLSIFISGSVKHNYHKTSDSSIFLLTFYASFIGWWGRIFLLGIYSKIFIQFPFVTIPALLSLTILSFYQLKKIILRYFINWDVIIASANRYITNEKYSRAQKICQYVLKKTNKEGRENNIAYANAVLTITRAYINEGNKNKLDNSLKILNNFIQRPTSKQFNIAIYYYQLLEIYCELEQYNKANIIANLKMLEQEKNALINYIEQHKLKKYFIVTA